jgi:glycosyltransferase involved in cell wall biosynthesis
MLCENNENTIGDSLGRIRPFVDEVVVLDLESNDRSTQIALEYDARVYQGQFADDIASLRNATIRRATSDWILVLDADELIDEQQTQKILGLVKSIPDEVLGVQVHMRASEASDASVLSDSEVRLFRNRNGVLFTFRACERVDDSIARLGGRILQADLEIRRTGLCDAPVPSYRSSHSLLRLLHLDLADNPDDASVLFNLGRVHFRTGNFFNAECYLNDCLQRSKPDDAHYRTAALWLIEAHIRKGDPYRAREVGDFVQKQIPDDSGFHSNISRLIASIGE